MINLDDIVPLRRSNIFKLSVNNADILPVIYGSHNVGGEFGLINLVEIEENHAYLISDSPIHSVTAIYDGNNQEITDGFDIYTNGSYKSVSNISFIKFTNVKAGKEDDFPYVKPFTGRCIGKVDSNGQVIENPISVLLDFLKTRGDLLDDDFDITSINQSIAELQLSNAALRWIFDSEKSVRDWALEICYNFLGNLFTKDRRIYITINPPVDKCSEARLEGNYIAEMDCANGEDGPRYSVDIQNVVTSIGIEFNYDWKNNKFLNYIEVSDEISVKLFKTPQLKKIQLRGIKSTAFARQIANYLLRQYSAEKGFYIFDIKHYRAMNLKYGSLLALTWNYGPGGGNCKNEILKVMDNSLDISSGNCSIKAIETFCFIVDATLADGSKNADGSFYAKPVRRQTVDKR